MICSKKFSIDNFTTIVDNALMERVYFIKLGDGKHTDIAERCIAENLLWLGFNEASESVVRKALENELGNPDHNTNKYSYKEDWTPVRQAFQQKNETTRTNNALAIRRFYTATEDDYFFTFLNSTMYYCQPSGEVIPIAVDDGCFTAGSRIRKTNGWKNCALTDPDIILGERRLSGRLTKTKIFRGTICELDGKDKETFFNTLQWNFPEYAMLEKLRKQSLSVIKQAIKELNPHDFEILVDLILTKSGWIRIGELGGQIKAVDMEYYLPVEQQTIYVQVKAVLKQSELNEALDLLAEELAYEKDATCYFAFHTLKTKKTNIPEKYKNLRIKLLDGDAIASLCNNHQEAISWLFLRTTGRE